MVVSPMGTLSDRRIKDALEWQEDDERYRTLIRSRMQRRRGSENVRRSYSCEDLSLLVASGRDVVRDMGSFKRTFTSIDRKSREKPRSRPESPAQDQDAGELETKVNENEKAKRSGFQKSHKMKKVSKSKREKKTRIRRHTKTVSFPANSLLHYAVLEDDMDMIRKLMLQGEPIDLDTLSKEGTAPLHEAAVNGNITCVNLLLEHGASVDVLDAEGYTPLEYAVYAGQFDCASLLITHGANISKIKDGCSLPLAR